jgi:hypothetical protein
LETSHRDFLVSSITIQAIEAFTPQPTPSPEPTLASSPPPTPNQSDSWTGSES